MKVGLLGYNISVVKEQIFNKACTFSTCLYTILTILVKDYLINCKKMMSYSIDVMFLSELTAASC